MANLKLTYPLPWDWPIVRTAARGPTRDAVADGKSRGEGGDKNGGQQQHGRARSLRRRAPLLLIETSAVTGKAFLLKPFSRTREALQPYFDPVRAEMGLNFFFFKYKILPLKSNLVHVRK